MISAAFNGLMKFVFDRNNFHYLYNLYNQVSQSSGVTDGTFG